MVVIAVGIVGLVAFVGFVSFMSRVGHMVLISLIGLVSLLGLMLLSNVDLVVVGLVGLFDIYLSAAGLMCLSVVECTRPPVILLFPDLQSKFLLVSCSCHQYLVKSLGGKVVKKDVLSDNASQK